jgi:hypothetical protein
MRKIALTYIILGFAGAACGRLSTSGTNLAGQLDGAVIPPNVIVQQHDIQKDILGFYLYPDQGNPTCTLSPASSGASLFSEVPNGPFANCLWPHNKWSSPAPLSHFVFEATVSLSDPLKSEGVEVSANYAYQSRWYKFSFQCSYVQNAVRVWDTASGHWVNVVANGATVPCPRQNSGQPTHFEIQTHVANGQITFETVWINGAASPVNLSFNPVATSGNSPVYGVHFQMDGDSQGDSYSTVVSEFNFFAW